jgi:nucleoside 2-deoxyribosyltransferase
MRGIPDYNYPAFNAVADLLRKQGHTPLNPACNPPGLTPAQYMDIDLAMLRAADAILLLPGWEESKGARVEANYAAYLGIPTMALENLPC